MWERSKKAGTFLITAMFLFSPIAFALQGEVNLDGQVELADPHLIIDHNLERSSLSLVNNLKTASLEKAAIPGLLFGTVTDAFTGQGVAGAAVTLEAIVTLTAGVPPINESS